VVPANTDIIAGVKLSSTLPNDNRSSWNPFTCECFDAQAFACTISTVAGSPATFFMCHLDVPVCCKDAGVNYFVEIDLILTDVNFCRWPRFTR
jgi:hypothetical protein